MNGRKLRPLLLPVGVAFFQSILKIFGRPGNAAPADILVGAFVSQQTGEFRSAMILAHGKYADFSAVPDLLRGQRGGPTADRGRVPVFPDGGPAEMVCRSGIDYAGLAAAYCGVYLACQGAVALTRTTLPTTGGSGLRRHGSGA